MAFDVAQRIIAQSSNTAASVTTSGVTTTSGNLLVVSVVAFGNNIGASPVTDSKSNTWTAAIASTGTSKGFGAMFYVANCTGGASHTFTFTPTSNDFIAIAVLEVSGAATSSVLSNTNSASNSTATHSSGNITAGASFPEIFVGSMALSANSEIPATVTKLLWPWTFTNPATTREGIMLGYKFVDPSVTDSFTVTANAASNETIMIAGFKSATAPSGSAGGAWAFA